MELRSSSRFDFGTIQNNTALKLVLHPYGVKWNFGTIQNNTALKQELNSYYRESYFGTIQNNTALKPRAPNFRRGFVIALFVLARLQL